MEQISPLSWLFSRRSIRKYSDRQIAQADIDTILRAAMYAPSAVNKQPWHFIVTSDKALFDKVMEIHPNAKFLGDASHAILVCGDEKLQHDDGYYLADCGAATQNILLAAHMLGIGSCWIGIYPRAKRMEHVSELFGLPPHVRPFSLVSLGYPAEEKRSPERFDRKKIHVDHWGNQSEK
jgi:nitroreductase